MTQNQPSLAALPRQVRAVWLRATARLSWRWPRLAGTAVPVIEGLDAVAALARLGGQRTVYCNLLRTFARDYGGAAARLQAAVAARQGDEARRQCHTLVAIAGMLGAARLALLGRALQSTLHAGTPCAEALTAFADEYARLHGRVDAALNDT